MRFEYKVRKIEMSRLGERLNHYAAQGWRLVTAIPESRLHVNCILEKEVVAPTPTRITFQEITMAPTEAGQSQVFTGTLAPAGSAFPTDAVFTVTSNDTAVSPSVDATGLIVSVTYPTGWVESTTTPLAFTYGASSASNPTWTLSATITPSAPPVGLPTSITFAQTT
jgi:hypothetical protein